jgi:uncharacterized membrane protein YcaP (DUF421 family)
MATIIRATIAYWVLLFSLRAIGRRAVNQMTPFELILLFLIGGMSIQAVVYDDRSLANAILAIFTVAMNHVLVAWLKQKSVLFRKLADGTPIILVENGHWHLNRMGRMRIQEQDVMSVARQSGIKTFDEIDTAIVERNGAISIFKVEDKQGTQKKKTSPSVLSGDADRGARK